MTKSYKEIYLENVVPVTEALDKNDEMQRIIKAIEDGILETVKRGEAVYAFSEMVYDEGDKTSFNDAFWAVSKETGYNPQQVASYFGAHFAKLGVGVHETKEALLFFIKDVIQG